MQQQRMSEADVLASMEVRDGSVEVHCSDPDDHGCRDVLIGFHDVDPPEYRFGKLREPLHPAKAIRAMKDGDPHRFGWSFVFESVQGRTCIRNGQEGTEWRGDAVRHAIRSYGRPCDENFNPVAIRRKRRRRRKPEPAVTANGSMAEPTTNGEPAVIVNGTLVIVQASDAAEATMVAGFVRAFIAGGRSAK